MKFEHENPEPPMPGWKLGLHWLGGLLVAAFCMAALWGGCTLLGHGLRAIAP